MEKLDNLDALEMLATEVNKVHSLYSNSTKAIEAQNAYASKSSMWDKLKWGYARKVAQIGADVYNQEYAILPDTIPISPQIACIFAREISDYEKEKTKAEWRVGRHMFTIPASALYATLFPNTHSVSMTARGIGKFVEALKRYDDDYDALAKRANNNIHHVASIYQLTEAGAGEYILKRGSWWAGITHTDYHGVADYAPMINWQTVGIDKNLNIKSLSMYVEAKTGKGRG